MKAVNADGSSLRGGYSHQSALLACLPGRVMTYRKGVCADVQSISNYKKRPMVMAAQESAHVGVVATGLAASSKENVACEGMLCLLYCIKRITSIVTMC